MNQLNLVSNLPYNQLIFEQESGTKKGVLIVSGIKDYTVEAINNISIIDNLPVSFFNFANKDIAITNEKHSFVIEKDRPGSQFSFLRLSGEDPLKVQFGNKYFDISNNTFVDSFDLTYKEQYLNLNRRPHVNGTGVLLSGEAGNFNDLTLTNSKIKFGRDENYIAIESPDPIYTFAGGPSPVSIDTHNGTITIGQTAFQPGQNQNFYIYHGPHSEFLDFGLKQKTIKFGDYNPNIGSNEINTQYNFKSGVSGYIPIDSEVVHTTGNETISGQKTFTSDVIMSGNLQVSETGIFNAIDLNNIDNLSLSGVDITVTSGVVNLTNPLSAPNIVYNTGNQDISGVKNFSSLPTVNNTRVLLSGQNIFTIALTHTSNTPQVGFNYFGMNEMGYSQASLGLRRRIPIAETCQIRKASWSHVVGTTGSPAVILSTGYIINTSSIPPQTGIVSTVIDSSNDAVPAHKITNFFTPINVTSGDLIVAALFISGFVTPPSAVRDSVILYCYN